MKPDPQSLTNGRLTPATHDRKKWTWRTTESKWFLFFFRELIISVIVIVHVHDNLIVRID